MITTKENNIKNRFGYNKKQFKIYLNTNCNNRRTIQGGSVAAPVGGQILSEVLPYLEVYKSTEEDRQKTSVKVPDVRNKSIKEAIQVLKESELDININAEGEIDKETTIIKEQMPKPGLQILTGSKVEVYVD